MKSRLLVMGIVMVAVASGALAQDSGTGAINPDRDPRLRQRVRLRWASVPLGALLAQLGQKTGVHFEADEAVQEYRACLYVPDRPLHEALVTLAQAFGYEWRRLEEPSKPPRYRLYDPNPPQATIPDDAARQTLETLRRLLPEVCEYLKTPVAQRMEAVLKLAEETGGRPPQFENEAQARQWFQRTFRLWAGVDPRSLGAWYALCQFTERDWQRLQRGERILLSSKHTPALHNAVLDWTAVVAEQVRDNYERHGRGEGDQWYQEWQLAQQKFPRADEMRLSLRLDPGTGKLYAATVVFAEGENIVPYSMNNRGAEWDITPPTDFMRRRPAPPSAWSLPDHPAFRKSPLPFKEPPPDEDWFCWLGELLTQAAEASALPLAAEVYPLLADFFDLYQWGEYFPKQYDWQTIAKLLREWGYRLALSRGDWIIVSSEQRTIMREQDIPQPTLARWFYKPGRRGVLTLDECAEIASLGGGRAEYLYTYVQSYSQRMETRLPWFREAMVSDASELCGGLPDAQGTMVYFYSPTGTEAPHLVMRLYARLSPAQRTALRQGAAIPFASLDTEAQTLFLSAFAGGSLLLFQDYWLPPAALQERAQTATLRLSATLSSRPGIDVPDALKQPERRAELIQWLQDPANRQAHWRRDLEQRRIWQFILRWGDQERVIELPMGHPVRLEGGI